MSCPGHLCQRREKPSALQKTESFLAALPACVLYGKGPMSILKRKLLIPVLPGGCRTYGAGRNPGTRNFSSQRFSWQPSFRHVQGQPQRNRANPSATIITDVRNNTSSMGQKVATASPSPKVTACIPLHRASRQQASAQRFFPNGIAPFLCALFHYIHRREKV